MMRSNSYMNLVGLKMMTKNKVSRLSEIHTYPHTHTHTHKRRGRENFI